MYIWIILRMHIFDKYNYNGAVPRKNQHYGLCVLYRPRSVRADWSEPTYSVPGGIEVKRNDSLNRKSTGYEKFLSGAGYACAACLGGSWSIFYAKSTMLVFLRDGSYTVHKSQLVPFLMDELIYGRYFSSTFNQLLLRYFLSIWTYDPLWPRSAAVGHLSEL